MNPISVFYYLIYHPDMVEKICWTLIKDLCFYLYSVDHYITQLGDLTVTIYFYISSILVGF